MSLHDLSTDQVNERVPEELVEIGVYPTFAAGSEDNRYRGHLPPRGRRRRMQPRGRGPTTRKRVARGLDELTGRGSQAHLGLRLSDRKLSPHR